MKQNAWIGVLLLVVLIGMAVVVPMAFQEPKEGIHDITITDAIKYQENFQKHLKAGTLIFDNDYEEFDLAEMNLPDKGKLKSFFGATDNGHFRSFYEVEGRYLQRGTCCKSKKIKNQFTDKTAW